jgi:CRP/FNR family transcriptional regulator, cyclic AMP receptor protein
MMDFSSLAGVGATSHSFDAGEKVFKQDDPASHLYVVRTGRIQIVTYGTVLENVGPGGVFGEMALIDEAPRSAAAIAMEPTEVVELSRAQFLALVQETPEFALHIMAILANRIRKMNASL